MKVFRLQPLHFVLAFVLLFFFCEFAAKRQLSKELSRLTESLTELTPEQLSDSTHSGDCIVLFYKSDSKLSDYMQERLIKLRNNHVSDNIRYYQIDVNTNDNLIDKYTLSLVPMILAFKDGQEQQRIMGLVPASNLNIIHNRLLYEQNNTY
ncbi:MAG: thioredoxin family protein [Dysgonamonadaceae bacterium]